MYIYLIVAAVIGVAYLMGRSLDKAQSRNGVVWKTGCIGRKTIFQSVVLGFVGGPIIYALKGGREELWFCVACMMAAPFIVDLLRPTYRRSSSEA